MSALNANTDNYIDILKFFRYNDLIMIIKQLLLASESYTHTNWVFHNVNVRFSRLYYIIDGEAYYKERDHTVRFKKGYLYLTPVNTPFDLYENADDKLLHTYVHIITLPEVSRFTEIKVEENTPLADAVSLWRKYARSENHELISNIIAFLLSQISDRFSVESTVAERTKQYLDSLEGNELNTKTMSHALGYSREHITRAFSAMYKITPMRYFNARRMSAAVEKLCRGETIQSVAEQRLLTTAVQNILCRRDTSNFFAFYFWKCKKTKPVCLRWALAFI